MLELGSSIDFWKVSVKISIQNTFCQEEVSENVMQKLKRRKKEKQLRVEKPWRQKVFESLYNCSIILDWDEHFSSALKEFLKQEGFFTSTHRLMEHGKFCSIFIIRFFII